MKTTPKTREELIAEWDLEAKRSQYLWMGAAREIRNILQKNNLADALPILKQAEKSCRKMAINVFFARAIRDVKAALKVEKKS